MEALTDLLQFIDPKLLVLIPVCWGLGLMIKATKISNNFIPFILGSASVGLATLWLLGTASVENIYLLLFSAITQGILCWLASWWYYEKRIKPKLAE